VSLKAKLSNLKSSTIKVRGEEVAIRELTAGQRAQLYTVFKDDPVAAMPLVCAFCARDGGNPMFTAEEAAELPPDVVDAIANEALKLSGMGGDSPND
jgi:hypothetical protein